MDHFISWLAGFVDGEGSFIVSVSPRTSATSGRMSLNVQTTVRVAQHSAHKGVLDDIAARLGFGRVYVHKGGRMSFFQTTRREEARRLAAMLLPHLRIKASAAKQLVAAVDVLNKNRRAGLSLYHGERVLQYDDAVKLAHISASINERPIGGGRISGRSVKQLLAVVADIYGQTAIEPRRIAVQCAHCGEPAERYISQAGKQNLFCSRLCSDEWRRASNAAHETISVTCAHCGKNFRRVRAYAKPRNLCSSLCRSRFHKARRAA